MNANLAASYSTQQDADNRYVHSLDRHSKAV